MKNIILLLAIIPVIALAQKGENYSTITPYANLYFKNNMVHYTIGHTQLNHQYRLSPVMYDKNMLAINYSNELTPINGTYIKKSQTVIRGYVNTEPVGQLARKDKLDYLKLCALLIIWDNDLSSHAVKELEKLNASSNGEIKENAELVIRLFEFYQQNNRRK